MIVPFEPGQLGAVLCDLGRSVRGDPNKPTRHVAGVAPGAPAQDIGAQLFTALFSGSVRSLLDQSLGLIHSEEFGLRIKIHIDPEDPSLAVLASLPWEFLYRRETRDWLSLSKYTPIVRYLDVQRPHTPLALKLLLHILVVLSQPADTPALDLARERALIEASWAKVPGVEVEFLEGATLEALRDRLSHNIYHVLHYMGHGGFDEHTGRGVLLLEGGDAQAQPVDGPTLAILLRDVPSHELDRHEAENLHGQSCRSGRVSEKRESIKLASHTQVSPDQ